MPEYTSTLLLAFILASCFHKKHIKDWWWFKLGLISYLASTVAYVLRSPGGILYSIMLLTNYAALIGSGLRALRVGAPDPKDRRPCPSGQ